mgnify:CR=1 FL=1
MVDFKELHKDQDIPYGGNGNVAKAGTPMHKAMLKAMELEHKEEVVKNHKKYIAQITTHMENLEGFSEDDYTEAFIIRKTIDGITVEAFSDENLVRSVAYSRNNSKKKKTTESK